MMGFETSSICQEGITGISVVIDKKEWSMNGWTWFSIISNLGNIPLDVTKGTGSNYYIYFYYTKEPAAGKAINEIKFLQLPEAIIPDNYSDYEVAKWNYNGDNADLKKGTGGYYLYLLYKRIDESSLEPMRLIL